MASNDDNYTRTGNSWLASFANKLSYVPLGGFISAPLLMLDGMLSGFGWLVRGKIFSAATAVASGATSSMIAGAGAANPIYWIANPLSGMVTGHSIQEHGRALVEGTTSFVTKPLGMQPTVLKSYYAGIGSTGAQIAPSGPGRFASNIANERGQDPNAAYANYMRGEGGVHVNELQSANGRGA